LHPVFHVSLLEPYKDPSDFHAHTEPQPFKLKPTDDPATQIASILDARKTGRRFEYLVRYQDRSEDENAWIPLSDVPRTCDELIERFHRHHPRAPRPPPDALQHEYTVTVPSASIPAPPNDAPPVPTATPELPEPSAPPRSMRHAPALVSAPTIPSAMRHTPSPPPVHENLRANYVPPTQTTTRSSRVVHPPTRYDPA
ncbi:hypothetical protein OBBRIDRAFT_868321, partial [Obba rivulosa]